MKTVGLIILGMLLWSALLNGYILLSDYTESKQDSGCTTQTCWS